MMIYLNPSPQKKRKKNPEPSTFLSNRNVAGLTKGWRVGKAVVQNLNHVTSMQTGTLRRARRFHSENNKTSGQENISSDLLSYLKG